MGYYREFYSHWPNLLGCAVGLALGSAMHHYLLNLFGPALIADFGWTKAQFALVGSLGLVAMLVVPFAGRFVDRFGPRMAAIVGFIVVPLSYLAFSMMTGPVWQFYAIYAVKNVIGILTTTIVFGRVIVERFDAARGISLSILMTGAPLAGAITAPIVGGTIDEHGWRAGYQLIAAISAAGGLFAIVLMGRTRAADRARRGTEVEIPARPRIADLVRDRVFRLLVAGMLLVNFPQVIVMSQIKLVGLDHGATSEFATWLVTLYAMTVIFGRFVSGLALDRVPAHLVALASLGLPAIGYLLLATPLEGHGPLALSIALIGLAQGAEGDLGAFIASRKFDMRHYSFIYSFVVAAIGISGAVGSIALSGTLQLTGSYAPFMALAAALTLAGAFCFYLTGREGAPARIEGVPA